MGTDPESAETGSSGMGACAAPAISTTETTLIPGADIDLTVTDVVNECLDEGQEGAGVKVEFQLEFEQEGRRSTIATFDGSAGPVVSIAARIPADANAGQARIVLGNDLGEQDIAELPVTIESGL